MTVLWLGNDPLPDQWEGAKHTLVRVLSPEGAHEALERHFPEIIVVGHAEWAREWVRVFPCDTRPAIVALGFGARSIAALADEWMLPNQSAGEIAGRSRIAAQPDIDAGTLSAPWSTHLPSYPIAMRRSAESSAEQTEPGVRGEALEASTPC